MKIKLACGTNNGKEFTKDHFGESKFYLIYEMDLDNGTINLIEKRQNNSSEEEIHGDPKKAKAISELLKDIQVLIAFAMGPNIIRMRKRFVPVISRISNINEALSKIGSIKKEIRKEIEKPQEVDKEILFLK